MKKSYALIAAAAGLAGMLVQIGTPMAATQQPVEPITSGTDFFAIIDSYDQAGQSLQIRMINAPMSRDGLTILFPNDRITGIVEPLKPGLTRQAVCVTAIDGREGRGKIVNPHRPLFPREGCLGQLHDYEGAAGLPATDIRAGLPVRIFLNGDLVLEGKKR